MSQFDADVLVIGAGPAGASVAIRLALVGWRVAIIEQARYPRQKVCGECLGPSSLQHLCALGLADRVQELASPEIRRVAWMTRAQTTIADMPPATSGPYRYGRAIGRDCLDSMLLQRASELGVHVIQPARARHLHGARGEFVCEYRRRPRPVAGGQRSHPADGRIRIPVVIDAHGSAERWPALDGEAVLDSAPLPARGADLLGFKTTFLGTALPSGLLPVLSLPGSYGGMVVSDRGRTTVACCIRRDVLREWRLRLPGHSAGAAVDAFLRTSCRGVAAALEGARAEEGWDSIGSLRPGFHPPNTPGVFAVGNAAAEAHPLIGEGICMAFESSALLATFLGERPRHIDRRLDRRLREAYVRAMYAAFAQRLHLAHLYSHLAMHERIGTAIAVLIGVWPRTLTFAAQLAGKARSGTMSPP